VSLALAKLWLRVSHDDEDELIQLFIDGAGDYLFRATGRQWDETNHTAKLVALALITDWYENRELVSRDRALLNVSEKLRHSIQSMILQLQLAPEDGGDE